MAMLKKVFRVFTFAFLSLAILTGAAWLFENWRGSHEWKKSKERADALGVSLNLDDYFQPEIGDEDNLLQDPIFIAEWDREIDPPLGRITSMKLPGLKHRGIKGVSISRGRAFNFSQYFDEEISEEEAVKRVAETYEPVAKRLDLLADAILRNPPQDFFVTPWDPLNDLPKIAGRILNQRKFAMAFREGAFLAIGQGDTEKALLCCLANARLSANGSDPALINKMVAASLLQTNGEIVWEGIRRHQWSDHTLRTLATLLPVETDFESLKKNFYYETAFSVGMVDNLEELSRQHQSFWQELSEKKNQEPAAKDRLRNWFNFRGPAGWQDWRRSAVLNQYLDLIEARDEWSQPWKDRFTNEIHLVDDKREPSFHPLAHVPLQNLGGPIRRMAKHTTHHRLTQIAIALEQHYLKQNAYPDTLDQIDLKFPIIDLTDPKKRALQYKKTNDGYFAIWSEYEKEMNPSSPQIRWQFSEKALEWR